MLTYFEQVETLLRKLALFADVSEADVAALAQRCVVEEYAKETTLFEQGDPCDRVWFVLAGRVKIVYQDVDGREVILEMIAMGEAFGGAVLFFPHHPATARTAEASVLCTMPAEVYAAMVGQHPQVAIKLLRMVGRRHLAMLKMQTLIGERVERRIASVLLKLADRCGRPDPEGMLITTSMTRQDYADMAGTTLESAIRVLSRFAREGLIHTHSGGYIVIRDLDRLVAIAQPDRA